MSGSDFDDFDSLAVSVRTRLGIPFDERPDLIDLLRRARYVGLISDYQFVPAGQLGDAYARWDAVGRIIWIRDDKREALEASDAEATFTVFHELSHAVLGHSARDRRLEGTWQHGRFIEADEADADRLARALMAPYGLAAIRQDTTAAEIASRFGLPLQHAAIRTEDLKRRQRKELGIKRALPELSARTFDTGDYDEAFAEMGRNAMRWNSRE